ncbi:MAG: magnesium transporter MgtE [Thermomicrobiales bacterium]|nr:MAG: magnesium transporter MgtE [Thermomicrobiales bacterium]
MTAVTPDSGATAAAPLLDELQAAIASDDRTRARQLAARLLEEDALALLKDLDPAALSRLFQILGDETLADLLERLDERDAADILERMNVAEAADVLEEIQPDDATDILEEIDPAVGDVILVQMEPAEAAELRELMTYPPDTAGGIMTPAFVSISPELRADQAIAALRKVAEHAETVNYVYVLDKDEHLLGVLSLHKLVLSRADTPVSQLMYRDPIAVRVDTDQEEAARILTEHDLLALPVIDDQGRLAGIITADDVADVLEEEVTEDIERLGGSAPLAEPYLRASPVLLFRKRIIWLMVLFMAQFVTVSIIDHFEHVLAQATVLSLFIPILIGTGGNIGSQTVTTIIRSLAIGEAAPRHVLRILRKEMATGLALGAVMATLMFGRALLTSEGTTEVGLTVAVAVLAIAVWAATVGAVLPLALTKLRVDPAVVSTPFISSFVDGSGLIIYFTLAQLLLDLG